MPKLSEILERSMCWGMFLAIAISPWPFGCVYPIFELYLSFFFVGILALWCGSLIWNDNLVLVGTRRAGLPWLLLSLLILVVAIPVVEMPTWVSNTFSPSAGKWREITTPEVRESLIANAGSPSEIPYPQSRLISNSLSLNPNGNLQMAFRLSALALLFVAAASVRRPASVLSELAWVGVFVGTAVAMVALLQKVSPNPQQIFWYFEGKGSEFGPFLNKNHYPFFANLAIGLTIGLLFERWTSKALSWGMFFHDSVAMWLIASLSLQLTSLAMSLSRGGIAALFTAVTLCVLLRTKRVPGISSALALAFLASTVVAFMVWAGFDLFTSRLTTLSEIETYKEDGRWYLWRVAAMVFLEFPLWGAGGETFRYWQTIIQFGGAWNSANMMALRADNEYLDILCEHGVFAGVLLTAFVVVLLASLVRRSRESGLAAGALIAMLSVSIHSIIDFGLRNPATATFATVIAALSYATRHGRYDVRPELTRDSQASSRMALVLPFLNFLVVLVVMVFLYSWVQTNQRYAIAEQHELAAFSALQAREFDRVRSEIKGMADATPEDVLSHLECARIALLASTFTPPEESKSFTDLMVVHCVQARDLCPLIWESPFWISQKIDQLAKVDTSSEGKASGASVERSAVDYLRIAHLLHPSNSTISYLLGAELFDRSIDVDMALVAWKASLLYSPRYVKEILNRALTKFTPQEVLDRIFPANAATLVSAATIIESLGHPESKKIFLLSAAQAIEQSLSSVKPIERHTAYSQAADIQSQLGNLERAVEFSRQAISSAPTNTSLRFQLVRYLIDLRRLEEAKLELNRIQSLDSGNPQLLQLRNQIFEMEHPRVVP